MLRKIRYIEWKNGKRYPELIGWFHCFSMDSMAENTPSPVAIVERENGKVVIVPAEEITFVEPLNAMTLRFIRALLTLIRRRR